MPWAADGKWIPEDDSVATRLTGLLGSNSTYMQTARAAGQRTAAKRGLLNSSIAGGAAESAAIAAAAPIASQDAAQVAQKNQAVLEGGIGLANQTKLNEQQNQASLTLQQREANYATDRIRLEQQGATAQQLREFDQRTQEQERGLAAEANRQRESLAAQSTQQQASLSSAERQAAMANDTNIRQTQISANNQLISQYLSSFSQLASNPDIPAATRDSYIREFQRVMQQGQALIGVVNQAQLRW